MNGMELRIKKPCFNPELSRHRVRFGHDTDIEEAGGKLIKKTLLILRYSLNGDFIYRDIRIPIEELPYEETFV